MCMYHPSTQRTETYVYMSLRVIMKPPFVHESLVILSSWLVFIY